MRLQFFHGLAQALLIAIASLFAAVNTANATQKYCSKLMAKPLAPHFCQETDYTCGPAALRSYLASEGVEVGEAFLAGRLKTDTTIGTRASDIVDYLGEIGFSGTLAHTLRIEDLEKHLREGGGILANIQLEGEGHWALVVAAAKDELTLMDPWYEFSTYRKVPRSEFLKDWWGDEGHSAAILIRRNSKN